MTIIRLSVASLVAIGIGIGIYLYPESKPFAIHPVPIANHIAPEEGSLLVLGEEALAYQGGGYRIALMNVITSPPDDTLALLEKLVRFELGRQDGKGFRRVERIYYRESKMSHKNWVPQDDPYYIYDSYTYFPKMNPDDIIASSIYSEDGAVRYSFRNRNKGECRAIIFAERKIKHVYGCKGEESVAFEEAALRILNDANKP